MCQLDCMQKNEHCKLSLPWTYNRTGTSENPFTFRRFQLGYIWSEQKKFILRGHFLTSSILHFKIFFKKKKILVTTLFSAYSAFILNFSIWRNKSVPTLLIKLSLPDRCAGSLPKRCWVNYKSIGTISLQWTITKLWQTDHPPQSTSGKSLTAFSSPLVIHCRLSSVKVICSLPAQFPRKPYPVQFIFQEQKCFQCH